jgi:hypothetical protein
MSSASVPTTAEIVATQIASAWLTGVKPKRRDVFTADLRAHIRALEAGMPPDGGGNCPQAEALAVLQSFLAVMEAKRPA